MEGCIQSVSETMEAGLLSSKSSSFSLHLLPLLNSHLRVQVSTSRDTQNLARGHERNRQNLRPRTRPLCPHVRRDTRVLRPPGLCQDTAMDTLLPRQPPEPQRVSLLPLGLGAFLASPAYLTDPAQQASRLFNLLGSLVRNVPIQMCATQGGGPAGGEQRGWGQFLKPKAILPVSPTSHLAPSQIFESSLLERTLGSFPPRKHSGPWKGSGGACFPVVVGEMVPSE